MSLFNAQEDYELMMKLTAEMHSLYYVEMPWWIRRPGEDADDFYSEDINYPGIEGPPTYTIPAAVNVADFGSGQNKVGGVQQERYLTVFISRRLLEDRLRKIGLDPYTMVPREEDVCKLQSMYWEAIDVDPGGYHSAVTYFPFEYNIKIRPYTPIVTTPGGRTKVE